MTDIVQKLWGFCHTLRHDGVDYGDYIEQITYLLFLKMADERGLKLAADPAPVPRRRSTRVAQPQSATNGEFVHAAITAPAIAADRKGTSAPIAEVERAKPAQVVLRDGDQMMAAIREVFSSGGNRTRQQAIKELSAALGYGRAGSRITESLNGDIRDAVRRGILENNGDGLRLLCRAITDYDRDFLVEQLQVGMDTTWWDREDLIEATARRLGFRRTGSVIRDTLKSTITTALRRGILESNGGRIRRVH